MSAHQNLGGHAVGSGFGAVGSGVGKMGSGVYKGLGDSAGHVGTGVHKVGSSVGKGVGNVGSGIGSGVSAVGSGVGSGVGKVGSGVGKVGSGVGSGVGKVGSGVGSGVGKVGSGVGSGVGKVGSGVGAGLKKVGGSLNLKKSKSKVFHSSFFCVCRRVLLRVAFIFCFALFVLGLCMREVGSRFSSSRTLHVLLLCHQRWHFFVGGLSHYTATSTYEFCQPLFFVPPRLRTVLIKPKKKASESQSTNSSHPA